MKRFSTCTTSERALSNAFVVGFQVTSKVFLFPKLFVAAWAFVWFLPSMGSLVSDYMIRAREGLATSLTTIFFSRLFRWWRVTIPGLIFLQLVNIT